MKPVKLALYFFAFLLTACLRLNGFPAWLQAPNPTQNTHPQGMPTSPNLLPYLHARTVIDFSQRELIELMPELKGMESTGDQSSLGVTLQKVGETVEAFVKDFPNVTALEQVYLERVEPGGINEQYLKRDNNYVIAADSDGNGFGFSEYRTSLKDERLNPGFHSEELQGAYFMTSGHASATLYFHPRQMTTCAFRYLGREKSGRRALLIAFAQKPELSGMTGTITLVGTEVLILKQGVAWVDPDTYQIIHIRSDLLLPRRDVGLDQHTTIVDLAEVRLGQPSRSLWLPREVRVILKWNGWRFQNRHRYSHYRLFSVESLDGAKKPLQPKSPL